MRRGSRPEDGEADAAFIVRRAGAEVGEDELLDLARAELARFKVPRHVLCIDAAEIPLTRSGRPRKSLLCELAAGRLGLT